MSLKFDDVFADRLEWKVECVFVKQSRRLWEVAMVLFLTSKVYVSSVTFAAYDHSWLVSSLPPRTTLIEYTTSNSTSISINFLRFLF